MANKQTPSDKTLLPGVLFLLGFFEFGAAAILILQIEPDPKNAILFGYSLSRLSLFVLASTLALWLLALTGMRSYRARFLQNLESRFQKAPLVWGLVVFSLALLAFVVLTIPLEMLEKYGGYLERVRPLLFVLCIFPSQISLNWLKKRSWRPDWVFLRPELISLGALLALSGFILLSGLGITPEQEHWNVAGNPVTSLQVGLILFITVLIFGVFGLIKPRFFAGSGRYKDWLIVLALFTVTVLFWVETPIPHNEFSSRPTAPRFESFPISDARVHDLGALAVLNGAGILFGAYTDKPLYMVFLAILHLFAGYNYSLLSFLHMGVMALMVPFLYVLGKSFHSHFFGFVLAGIILVRQQNAIFLSNFLNFNATPFQLLTEVPTLLGLIVFTCALFFWMRKPEQVPWRAFLAGSVLGAVSLIRLNPFLLVLATPVFLFFALRQRKKDWFMHSISFLLGCAVLIVPWMITGTNQSGQSFFVIKFYDVINVRYGPIGALPPTNSLEQPQNAVAFPPLSAGPSLPPLNIHTFPGFVINHTLHNFVGSFLTLPDSLKPTDQNLNVLMKRPIWSLGLERVVPQQIPFMLLNLGFLSLGLGWSWKRWKWAGLIPLFVFVIYSLSLGLGRTSGSRYLVPIDWLVDFYFVLGLLSVFQLFPKTFRQFLAVEPENELSVAQNNVWGLKVAIVAIFCLGALIPFAQTLIPPQPELCAPVNPEQLTSLSPLATPGEDTEFIYGEVLYPEIKKDNLSFTLLTCQRGISFDITGFDGKLAVGQRVIAVLSTNESYPSLKLLILPPGPESAAQILWQTASD